MVEVTGIVIATACVVVVVVVIFNVIVRFEFSLHVNIIDVE